MNRILNFGGGLFSSSSCWNHINLNILNSLITQHSFPKRFNFEFNYTKGVKCISRMTNSGNPYQAALEQPDQGLHCLLRNVCAYV